MTTKPLLPLALLALSCAHTNPAAEATPPAVSAAAYDAIVAAPDRLDSDRAIDGGRRPAQMLAFLGVRPGMKVADIGAAGGYSTELLARAVAPNGVVYGQNSPFILERFAEKPWSERLARPAMKGVVRVDREFESPVPPEVKDLDVALINAVYHDTVWLKVDRDKMNRAIFDALKPGGAYVVIDSSARAGTGLADVQTLHRIDEQSVKDEVTRAGFKLAGEADFLRHPEDTRDWSSSPSAAKERRGTGDRFVLKFVKP